MYLDNVAALIAVLADANAHNQQNVDTEAEAVAAAAVPSTTTAYMYAAESDVPAFQGWVPQSSCGFAGITCAKTKREADFEGWLPQSSCGFPGITCAKTKRAALAVAEALADYEPLRAPSSTCSFPGAKCDKARRSLEQLGSATESTLDNVLLMDVDTDAIAYKNKLLHAGFPGTKLVAKRDAEADFEGWMPFSSCGFAGITCAKTKRGIDLINEEFPNIHNEECFAQGGECHAVLKARAAFDAAIKREKGADLSSCGKPGFTCSKEVYNFALTKRDEAADTAGESCNGPEGACTKAQSYLDELDSALTKAQEEIFKNN